MSARDELAQILGALYGSQDGLVTDVDRKVARWLLAAGYTKPRTITTVDDLIELPDGSVILDVDGDVSQRRGGYWCGYEMANLDDRKMSKCLPATVLHEPTS